MHTWIWRIVVAVVVGVLATYGVAWWCGVCRGSAAGLTGGTPVDDFLLPESVEGQRVRVIVERVGFGNHSVTAGWIPAPGPDSHAEIRALRTRRAPWWLPSNFAPGGMVFEAHAGWPIPTLVSGQMCTFGPYRRHSWPSLTLNTGDEQYTVPITPLLPGFILSVVGYGGMYIVGVCAVAEVRRRRGIGRCSRCRYDLAGLANRTPCPECGTCPAASP